MTEQTSALKSKENNNVASNRLFILVLQMRVDAYSVTNMIL